MEPRILDSLIALLGDERRDFLPLPWELANILRFFRMSIFELKFDMYDYVDLKEWRASYWFMSLELLVQKETEIK